VSFTRTIGLADEDGDYTGSLYFGCELVY